MLILILDFPLVRSCDDNGQFVFGRAERRRGSAFLEGDASIGFQRIPVVAKGLPRRFAWWRIGKRQTARENSREHEKQETCVCHVPQYITKTAA